MNPVLIWAWVIKYRKLIAIALLVVGVYGSLLWLHDYIGDQREEKLRTKEIVQTLKDKEELDAIRNRRLDADDVIDSLRNGTF